MEKATRVVRSSRTRRTNTRSTNIKTAGTSNITERKTRTKTAKNTLEKRSSNLSNTAEIKRTGVRSERKRSVENTEQFDFKKPKLRIIPLGGLHEIGKNITVFEYGDEMIAVDCGLSFPEDDMLGVDLVIPDITYILKNQEKFKGLVITHGHEDHIGGIPYFLKQPAKSKYLLLAGSIHTLDSFRSGVL